MISFLYCFVFYEITEDVGSLGERALKLAAGGVEMTAATEIVVAKRAHIV